MKRDAPTSFQVDHGDNLQRLATLGDGCCHLIYVDPPFNCNRTIGPAKGSDMSFVDAHDDGLRGYLAFLKPRLRQMRRVLSPNGSIFVHVDWRSAHYVKILLDTIFGAENMLNEIIWMYRSGGRPGAWFRRKHDTIFAYARQIGDHTFHRLREGSYRTRDMNFDEDGRPYKSTRKGRLYFHPEGPAMGDVWDIPILSTVSRERTGYPTQKPLALLDRIIRSATNAGDVVADFFCGSGTTLVAAMATGRNAIGCDIQEDAVNITRHRIEKLLATRCRQGGEDEDSDRGTGPAAYGKIS
ncbi:MAG: DNA-methyltransferase [Planctomycetota bacterium]